MIDNMLAVAPYMGRIVIGCLVLIGIGWLAVRGEKHDTPTQ